MSKSTPTGETPEDMVEVGRTSSVYGIKGWIKVHSNTEPMENILAYSPWWLKTPKGLLEVEIDQSRQHGPGLVAHIKGVDDRDIARNYCGFDILVPRDQLPELDDGDYYWHQLVGLRVITDFDGQSQALGRITSILETGANDVLVVQGDSDSLDTNERLIPYELEQFINSVDLVAGEVRVNWDPEF